MVVKLENDFIGIGEVKGFKFKKIQKFRHLYIYLVRYNDLAYYEVFIAKRVFICLDFMKKIYSETDKREKYPKAKDFGKTAFTFYRLKDAKNKLKELVLSLK